MQTYFIHIIKDVNNLKHCYTHHEIFEQLAYRLSFNYVVKNFMVTWTMPNLLLYSVGTKADLFLEHSDSSVPLPNYTYQHILFCPASDVCQPSIFIQLFILSDTEIFTYENLESLGCWRVHRKVKNHLLLLRRTMVQFSTITEGAEPSIAPIPGPLTQLTQGMHMQAKYSYRQKKNK